MANSKNNPVKDNPVYLRMKVGESLVWLFGAYNSLEEAKKALRLYECIVEVKGAERRVVAGEMIGDALILDW